MSTSVATLGKRWFEEVWNQKSDRVMEEMLSPDCAGEMEGQGQIGSMGDFKAARARILAAFPDLSMQIEDTVEQGDKVAVRWIARATHCGHGFGLDPTGCRCEFRGMTWLEFRDGRVVRGWDSWDHGGLRQHLQAAIGQQ